MNMLTKFEKVQQQWIGVNHVIDNWLKERQAVLVSYCQLAGSPPFDKNDCALPGTIEIKRFCQVLIDYICAGHFEIFDELVPRCKTKTIHSTKRIQNIYSLINNSTDIAIKFNDKYAELKQLDLLSDFDENLSTLGRHLEERFDLEDQLIANLYQLN